MCIPDSCRRVPIVTAVASLTLSALAAQTPVHNEFGRFPGHQMAASRSGVAGTSTGDLLTQVGGCIGQAAQRDFEGVGTNNDPSQLGVVTGFRARIQDQDASTQEGFAFVVVANAAGNPAQGNQDWLPDNRDPQGVLLRTSTMVPPIGSGPTAWILTLTLATPAIILPESANFFYGVSLPPNSAWTQDGLSVQMATFQSIGPFPEHFDQARDGAPNPTWAINRPGANPPVQLTSGGGRSHEMYLLTSSPVLQVGASIHPSLAKGPVNPQFGMAGTYPDVNRGTTGQGDGLVFRVRAADQPNTGVYLGFSGPRAATMPFRPGGLIAGALLLDVQFFQLATGITDASGAVTLSPGFTAQGTMGAFAGSRLDMQAIVIRLPSLHLSNSASVSF